MNRWFAVAVLTLTACGAPGLDPLGWMDPGRTVMEQRYLAPEPYLAGRRGHASAMVQAGGELVIALTSEEQLRVERLRLDGTVVSTFNAPMGFRYPPRLTATPEGAVRVWWQGPEATGAVSSVAALTREGTARWRTTVAGCDPGTFQADANGEVTLRVGDFNNGSDEPALVRLGSDGQQLFLVSEERLGLEHSHFAVAPDGRVLYGGTPEYYGYWDPTWLVVGASGVELSRQSLSGIQGEPHPLAFSSAGDFLIQTPYGGGTIDWAGAPIPCTTSPAGICNSVLLYGNVDGRQYAAKAIEPGWIAFASVDTVVMGTGGPSLDRGVVVRDAVGTVVADHVVAKIEDDEHSAAGVAAAATLPDGSLAVLVEYQGRGTVLGKSFDVQAPHFVILRMPRVQP